MHQTGEYGYLDGGSFQALELPYAGNDLSMVVLLPKKIDGLAGLEKELDRGQARRLGRQAVQAGSDRQPAQVQDEQRRFC